MLSYRRRRLSWAFALVFAPAAAMAALSAEDARQAEVLSGKAGAHGGALISQEPHAPHGPDRPDGRIRADRNGGWSVRGAGAALHVSWRAGTVSVEPRRGSGWRLSQRLVGVGRESAVLQPPVPVQEALVQGDWLSWRRGPVTERYLADHRGVEQVFELHERPPGEGPLVLAIETDGLTPCLEPDRSAVSFRDAFGQVLLRESKLHVFDAAGREVAASFDARGSHVLLRIDDAGHDYPLVVDPLLATPSWEYSPVQAAASFGASVASAGDVDGDGHDDLIVGAPHHDGAQANVGSAFLFSGSSTGLSASPTWQVDGTQPGARFGFEVASAGDVNGDGYDDVLVSALLHDDASAPGVTDEGLVELYLGSSTGLATTPAWTFAGGQDFAWLGRSVASVGDLNGDGYSDVALSAPRYQSSASTLGRVFVFHGSATGLPATPNTVLDGDAYAYLGTQVASAGDVNADGFDDLVVGAGLRMEPVAGDTSASQALLFAGSASGLVTTPAWTLTETQSEELLGFSVAGAGDVDGDGHDDVLIGAPWHDGLYTEQGRVLAFHGSGTGLGGTAAIVLAGSAEGEAFGAAISSAGDTGGDGHDDVLVGAPWHDDLVGLEGRVVLHEGSASGLLAAAGWTRIGGEGGEELGGAVGAAGDVDGDGLADGAMGSPFHGDAGNQAPERGRAALHRGTP